MSYSIVQVQNSKEIMQFIKMPWKIYKNDPNWVPPLIGDMKRSLLPGPKCVLSEIPHTMFLLYKNSEIAGRIFAGIDTRMNKIKGTNAGYISLFECINDYDAAKMLFDGACGWLKAKGMTYVRGPVSMTGGDGDENKGLLVEGFDRPPVVMNSYNPPYYADLFEKYGFVKDYDLYAYYLDKDLIFRKNPEKIIEYAKKKYGFKVESIDFTKLDREINDIKKVLDVSIPDEWPDLVPPSLEEVKEMALKLKPLADPDLVIIARSGDEPVGFGLAIPDYNQVLKKLNGRLTPLSVLKFLVYKRKINMARVFTMFVVPEYRTKGVSYAIYYQIFLNGTKKGYHYGEGSTIGETNTRMRKDIESFGGIKYKTYRVYGLNL